MASFMDRLASQLQARLPAGYVAAGSPDHPHLLFGPDLMIGGEGRLVAVFRAPSAIRNLDLLLHRIIASRLALPSHVASVLLIESRNPAAVSHWLLQNFDFYVERDHAATELARIVTASGTRSRQDVPPDAKRAAHIRYDVLRKISERRRHRFTKGESPLAVLRALRPASDDDRVMVLASELRKPRPRHEDRFVQVGEGWVAAVPAAKKQDFRRAAQPAYASGLDRSFTLDNGVPYLRDISANVFIVSTWPSMKDDPDKPIRATAFAGWALTPVSSSGEVARLMERANTIIKGRMQKWPDIARE